MSQMIQKMAVSCSCDVLFSELLLTFPQGESEDEDEAEDDDED
jgi:hypothetical protein